MALDALDNNLDTQSSEQRLQAIAARLSTARARATALDARRLLASQDAADSLKYAHGPTHAQIEELRAQLTAALVEVEGLRIAMQSRSVIEQAKGMIMLREKCDAERAFELLVAASQRSHRKLREVATAVVARESGHEPVGEPTSHEG